MPELKVNFEKIIGPVKPLHAVGQPPWMGPDGQYLHYLTEANIPYSRLHDMGGPYGGFVYVDIPNIFRDFDADPEDPESYDFAFTDVLITKMMENNIEPVYRLGITIENYINIRRYRTYPPADFEKWAKICEHIIRHYNEGWADGFRFGITYWEIWNEPDSFTIEPEKSPMWSGTAEQYYELYAIASKHLKEIFGDSIKVGGYAGCGFYSVLNDPREYGVDTEYTFDTQDNPEFKTERYLNFITFFVDFLKYIKQHGAPLDFFSWHSYAPIKHTLVQQLFCEKILGEHGYGDVEIHLNEWNDSNELKYRGTSRASAGAAAMMCGLHSTKMSVMCYYDARIGSSQYGGMFDPDQRKPLAVYYSFKAFGELYSLGNCAASECDGVYHLAAASDDGKKRAILLSNIDEETVVKTSLSNMKAYLIEKDSFLKEIEIDLAGIKIGKQQVILLKNY